MSVYVDFCPELTKFNDYLTSMDIKPLATIHWTDKFIAHIPARYMSRAKSFSSWETIGYDMIQVELLFKDVNNEAITDGFFNE